MPTGASMAAPREFYRKLIEAVYLRWNDEKIGDISRIMEKYEGQEGEIYDKVVRKYVFSQEESVWRPLLEAMYKRFNPTKLADLGNILGKYKDSEAALFKALCDKYIPDVTFTDELPLMNVWGKLPAGSRRPVIPAAKSSKEKKATTPPASTPPPSQEEEAAGDTAPGVEDVAGDAATATPENSSPTASPEESPEPEDAAAASPCSQPSSPAAAVASATETGSKPTRRRRRKKLPEEDANAEEDANGRLLEAAKSAMAATTAALAADIDAPQALEASALSPMADAPPPEAGTRQRKRKRHRAQEVTLPDDAEPVPPPLPVCLDVPATRPKAASVPATRPKARPRHPAMDDAPDEEDQGTSAPADFAEAVAPAARPPPLHRPPPPDPQHQKPQQPPPLSLSEGAAQEPDGLKKREAFLRDMLMAKRANANPQGLPKAAGKPPLEAQAPAAPEVAAAADEASGVPKVKRKRKAHADAVPAAGPVRSVHLAPDTATDVQGAQTKKPRTGERARRRDAEVATAPGEGEAKQAPAITLRSGQEAALRAKALAMFAPK